MAQKIKVTYATMSADNEELQSAYDKAIARVKEGWLGAELPMFINGEKVYADEKFKSYSPIDTGMHLGTGQVGTVEQVKGAITAAKAAFPQWRKTPWPERVAIIRNIAETISANSMDISAMMILEVGKNRLEALGEVEETADLLRWYAGQMEQNNGYIREMGKLKPDDPTENNFSVLRPYGAWAVISPFNFPLALSAAPIAAALVAGNTVVFKGSPHAPYNAWKTTELFIEAGLPPGVFNSVIGPNETVGQEMITNPAIDGWTFTGSYQVGMQLYRQAAQGRYPRPAIIEMGGKNPTIVSNTADVTQAATGVMRAAFGMDGQKCSACSRVYVHEAVYDAFTEKLVEMTQAIKVGDPTARDVYMGTVINQAAYDRYKKYVEMARQDGTLLVGGRVLDEGDFARGYFVEPAIVAGLPEEHEIVENELFVPLLHLAKVESLEEAMVKANDTIYGLTAGFFGDEVDWFLENIQSGTVYLNRAAGSTTGAWPGVQAFGGWKASGSRGKGIGAYYTLPLYMHEQSRTIIG